MKIIIVGSGIAGITFAETYRTLSPETQITLLTREQDGYYSRPMLSHGFSRKDVEQKIILKAFNQLLEKNICVISGVNVTDIQANTRTITVKGLAGLEALEYDVLILATGSAAMIPPPLQPYSEQFFILNSLQDLKTLRSFRLDLLQQQRKPHWAVIGGGLIGCEVASDLAISGDQVTLFHAMDRLMERQLTAADSVNLLNVLQIAPVTVLLNQQVSGFIKDADKIRVNASGKECANFDAVIVSCGFKPRIKLATNAGLETGRGIKVNQYLQSSDENIYALGDVAELPNGKLYAFIMPIRHQASWLANYLKERDQQPWSPPSFNPKAKVHGFTAEYPYIF